MLCFATHVPQVVQWIAHMSFTVQLAEALLCSEEAAVELPEGFLLRVGGDHVWMLTIATQLRDATKEVGCAHRCAIMPSSE